MLFRSYQGLEPATRSHVELRSMPNLVTMKTKKRAANTIEMMAGRDRTRRKIDGGVDGALS